MIKPDFKRIAADPIHKVLDITSKLMNTATYSIEDRKRRDNPIVRDMEYGHLFFGSSANFAPNATIFFERCRKDRMGPPNLYAIVKNAIKRYQLDESAPQVEALLLATKMGEIPNNLPFHGNPHYRKVVLQAIRIINTHNEISPNHQKLNKDDITEILTAACIHDLGHNGETNIVDGTHIPGRMEKRSMMLVRKHFSREGFWGKEVEDGIGEIVMATDATPLGKPTAPTARAADIYKNREKYSVGPARDEAFMKIVKAMVVLTADIATSAGLSPQQTELESRLLARELNKPDIAKPSAILDFLNTTANVMVVLPAGKHLYATRQKSIAKYFKAQLG